MKIRTITTGIPSPFSRYQLQRAAKFNTACQTYFEANGYEVQTTRVSCQIWDEKRDIGTILKLESDAQALGIEFLNLGTILPEKRNTETHLARVARCDCPEQAALRYRHAYDTHRTSSIGYY